MSELITIGEPLVVLTSQQPDAALKDVTDFHRFMGGAELNVAIGAARLGHSVEYITQVGNDPFGEFILDSIPTYNVGTKYVFKDDYHFTGHQLKQLVTSGDPQTFYFRRDSAAANLAETAIDKIDLSDVKMAHLTGIFPAISKQARSSFDKLWQRLIDADIKITFDPNLRPTLWDSQEEMITNINQLATKADIVMPGLNEAEILTGLTDPEEVADFYLKGERTNTVIVKLGVKGAYIKDSSGYEETIPGFEVAKVVDTVGAGDGFALGVITGLLENKSLKSAVTRGTAVGALQVQTPGDNDGYPTPEQLQAFYAENGVTE